MPAFAKKAEGTKRLIAPKATSGLSIEDVVKVFNGAVAFRHPRHADTGKTHAAAREQHDKR